jgi:sarcosine oxidase subunit gamma
MAESVRITELPLYECLDLRLDPRNEAAASAVASALGAALPGPNAWVTAGAAQILWQAYDEWLILTADGRQPALATSLRSALADTHCAITDVTDLRAAFRLQGPHARDVLQKGCAVDLHPRRFGPSSCVTTALGRVRVTLRQVESAPAYEIFVERSYGAYLRDWLNDAAAEYD